MTPVADGTAEPSCGTERTGGVDGDEATSRVQPGHVTPWIRDWWLSARVVVSERSGNHRFAVKDGECSAGSKCTRNRLGSQPPPAESVPAHREGRARPRRALRRQGPDLRRPTLASPRRPRSIPASKGATGWSKPLASCSRAALRCFPSTVPFWITLPRPLGHVAAVVSMACKLGFERMLDRKPSRNRSLVAAMALVCIVELGSKLATARGLNRETLTNTLGGGLDHPSPRASVPPPGRPTVR